jgi:DNA-binding MarR family transcriptional regulator
VHLSAGAQATSGRSSDPAASAQPIDPAAASASERTFVELAAAWLPVAASPDTEVDPRANRLFLQLQRTSSAIFYDFESSIHRPMGSSWATFRILFSLWVAGPQSGHGLGKVAGMSRAAVSSLVAPLVARGDLRKDPDPADRRAVVLNITDQGRARIQEAFARQHARERQWAALLTPVEQEVLGMLLDKLMAGRRAVDANERA